MKTTPFKVGDRIRVSDFHKNYVARIERIDGDTAVVRADFGDAITVKVKKLEHIK